MKKDIEVIPTILNKSFKEVKERIKKVEDHVNWVQLDIMDGVFVNNETWPHFSPTSVKASRGKPYFRKELEKLKKLKTGVKLEAHLMINKPEEVIDDWLEVVDRVIIHFESKITNRELGIREMIKKTRKWKPIATKQGLLDVRSALGGKEIGLALNPETHPAVVTPFLKDLDLVLFMTVQPGWGGQEFKDWVLKKIEVLRKLWPNGSIEVDGGINPETAKKTIKAGANLICAGTYIFRSKDIEKAIKSLKNI
jgi:ribulose-phosphate 3-epimerase